MSEPEADKRPVPQARTRTIIGLAAGLAILFVIMLVVGLVARARTDRDLATATHTAQSAPPQVAVIKAEPASESALTVAATTQAMTVQGLARYIRDSFRIDAQS